MGASLALLELGLMLEAVARRLPAIELLDVAPVWRHSHVIRRFETLEVGR